LLSGKQKRVDSKNNARVPNGGAFIVKKKSALIKKKTKFSTYIMKFRWDRVQSHMRKGFLIYEEMRKFFPIYEEAVSHL
jgi:hypothetical protein